jgi:hypothetical protein
MAVPPSFYVLTVELSKEGTFPNAFQKGGERALLEAPRAVFFRIHLGRLSRGIVGARGTWEDTRIEHGIM